MSGYYYIMTNIFLEKNFNSIFAI